MTIVIYYFLFIIFFFLKSCYFSIWCKTGCNLHLIVMGDLNASSAKRCKYLNKRKQSQTLFYSLFTYLTLIVVSSYAVNTGSSSSNGKSPLLYICCLPAFLSNNNKTFGNVTVKKFKNNLFLTFS